MSLENEFEESSKKVHSLKSRPSNDDLLKLYSLYKQGSLATIMKKKPGMLDIKGRKKHEAWSNLKGMEQTDAKKEYIELVKQLIQKDS